MNHLILERKKLFFSYKMIYIEITLKRVKELKV